MNVEQALSLYLKEIGKSRSVNTLKSYTASVEKFKATLTSRGLPPDTTPVSSMSNTWVEWLLDDLRHLAPTTERSTVAAIVGFYEYAQAKEWTNLNFGALRHFLKRRQRKLPKREVHFPKQQIEQFLHELDTQANGPFQTDRERLTVLRDRALFYLLADSGLRVSEACALQHGQIDREAGEAWIIGKGNKEARIRISERALNRLEDYLQARRELDEKNSLNGDAPLLARHDKRAGERILPLKPRAVQWALKSRDFTPHTFRHYFVTTVLRKSGGDVELAQKMARHSNVQTTLRYAHLSDDELNTGYDAIFNGDEK
jgi:integrase/recombinase XerC/integrase/recombinase XerD